MARTQRSPKLHEGPLATAGPAIGHAPDDGHLRTFRHRAWAFEVVDHEATPTVAAMLAGAAAILSILAVAGGGAIRADGAGLTAAAWMAVACLAAGLVSAASEGSAWLMARPIGRDVARAVAALEAARSLVARLGAALASAEPELEPLARRIQLATAHLTRRLADAEAAIGASAALPDARTRADRLGALQAEGRIIASAADALDATSHLLRWIEACPWSAARPEALLRLRAELETAERLVNDQAPRS